MNKAIPTKQQLIEAVKALQGNIEEDFTEKVRDTINYCMVKGEHE